MTYAPKIVLQLPITNPDALAPFLEACLRDKVQLIAVAGTGCSEAEDVIDDLIIGDGVASDRYITTSSHPGESLEEVLEFAAVFSPDGDEGVELVQL